MRRQIVLTLALMPITFGLWYAAGSLFAAPAVWLCDVLLGYLYPTLIDTAGLQGADMQLVTQFGESGGQLLTAKEAGNQIALEINTLLVSYSIAFYGALLMAANVPNSLYKFSLGLFWLWLIMAAGLASIAGKELLLLIGGPFLNTSLVPPADVIALTYQFNVLLMPTLAPIFLWCWQLRGSPLWEQIAADINRASSRA
jgi:hypothetical protein